MLSFYYYVSVRVENDVEETAVVLIRLHTKTSSCVLGPLEICKYHQVCSKCPRVSLRHPFPDVLCGLGTAIYPTMHCIFKLVLQKFTSVYLSLKKWAEKMMESDSGVDRKMCVIQHV